ncbi:hypothetical protein H5410_064699 [Solanum commersonii]|uniref:Uncharacterized protein n=1 Tax=Solanum commersonii TaxID=4109 RepID=A0A9J5VZA7_SOLCO|nr:hypothetical protein H5410_064699 [Solanum commersonii]
MLQPLSLWLQDGNEGRGGREEKVIRYWLTLISGLGYRSSVVTFTKGQPLGFLRSWPLFTLKHHMLVWIATERVYGTTKLCDYAILGDGDRRRELTAT